MKATALENRLIHFLALALAVFVVGALFLVAAPAAYANGDEDCWSKSKGKLKPSGYKHWVDGQLWQCMGGGINDWEVIKPYLPLILKKTPTKSPRCFWYTVRRGDTVYGIARKYGDGVWKLQVRNGLNWDDYIRTGQKLKVCPKR